MDERRQPDSGAGHPETSAWRVNGGPGPALPHDDQGWSSAGAALEPSAEPLALLATGSGGGPGVGQARHRQPYGTGLDDETPASGMPVVEPPLWREATRHTHRSGGYGPPFGEYRSGQVPGRPAGGPGDQEPPPAGPPRAGQPGPAEPPDRPAGAERLDPREPVEPPEPVWEDYPASTGLPQRVPAEPDVPVTGEPEPGAPVTGPPSGRDRWTAPELAFIADQLRRDDVPGDTLTGSFDVDAVVSAVREVPGVEAASVRTNPTGMHTLRLDLADDADPGQVSRAVARLLLERMGLSASPQDVPPGRDWGPAPRPDPWMPPAARVAPDHSAAPEPLTRPEASQPPGHPPPPEHQYAGAAADLDPAPPGPGPGRDPGAEPAPQPAVGAAAVGELLPESGGPAPPRSSPAVPSQARGHQDGWWYEGLADHPSPGAVDEPVPEPVSRPLHSAYPGPRVVIDQVQVRTFGLEATVEVLLTAGDRQATGVARGPAVDSYLVRLAAVAAARAIDSLLRGADDPSGPSRCFVEHTAVVGFGNADVAVVVLLLVCGGWVEQLSGSALVDGDPRQAVVRATLGAVNRRLEALLD